MSNSTMTVRIRETAPGKYLARATIGGVEFRPAETYDSLDSAIAGEATDVPKGLALFLEFTFVGMSTGTVTMTEAVEQAPRLAKRLEDFVSQKRHTLGLQVISGVKVMMKEIYP